MNIWALVLVLGLLIPILAIVLDSPVGRALADRLSFEGRDDETDRRLEALEAEVRYLTETLESLQEETEFLRSLVEGDDGGDRSRLDSGD